MAWLQHLARRRLNKSIRGIKDLCQIRSRQTSKLDRPKRGQRSEFHVNGRKPNLPRLYQIFTKESRRNGR